MNGVDIKSYFPIFDKFPGLVYGDNGATTLKPVSVIQAVEEYLSSYSANIHRGVYNISEIATERYEEARGRVAQLINAENDEIVFTRGTTDSINIVARAFGPSMLYKGDEVVVSQMEHHANLIPWQEAAFKKDAVVKVASFDPKTFELDVKKLLELINEKTKILAITQVSNVLGTVNPIQLISREVKKINPKVIILIDGAQAVAHMKVDVKELGVDFYAFSGHKMYGPTGIGVLWGRKELLDQMEPAAFGGGMIEEVTFQKSSFLKSPQRHEGGTPPIAEAIGLGEAAEFLKNMGMQRIESEEKALTTELLEELKTIEGLEIIGKDTAEDRLGVVSFVIEGIHPHDIASIADRYEVCVRSGHHCAMPLHNLLGLPATTRFSLGVYNKKEDIKRLALALNEARSIFRLNKEYGPAISGNNY